MDVSLRFVNQSQAASANVVIFQKNMAASNSNTAIAWQVFANTTPGGIYPFVYTSALTLAASDSYGNQTPRVAVENGLLFQLRTSPSGDELSYVGPASNIKDIAVLNNLSQGAASFSIYRNGALLASKTRVAPAQLAVFQFKPTIYIGVVPSVTQGKRMNNAIVQSVLTQISLLGMVSADIVMTGGGVGVPATPFAFNLANVVYPSGK